MRFKHSGALGDIIYSLPIIKQKYEETGQKQDLYLKIGSYITHPPKKKVLLLSVLFKIPQKIHSYIYKKTGRAPFNITWWYDRFYPRVPHPAKDVLLNQEGFDFIKPLLLAQPYIGLVLVYTNQQIDVDLDSFRNLNVNYQDGDIATWHMQATGMQANLVEPWLIYEKDEKYSDCIIWNRSLRVQNESIDFSVLGTFKKVYFVGLDSEYEQAKQLLPNLSYVKVQNSKDLLGVIGSSKLFIGNSSFCFALAEAIKINRLYEECLWCQSVKPKNNAVVFTNQKEFEHALGKYL